MRSLLQPSFSPPGAPRPGATAMAHDPAEALVEYARTADVDHILLGARGLTGVRRMLGSVSARVVAEAPCTATVVRVRGEPQAP